MHISMGVLCRNDCFVKRWMYVCFLFGVMFTTVPVMGFKDKMAGQKTTYSHKISSSFKNCVHNFFVGLHVLRYLYLLNCPTFFDVYFICNYVVFQVIFYSINFISLLLVLCVIYNIIAISLLLFLHY